MVRNAGNSLQAAKPRRNPPTKEYRIWSALWIVLLGAALGIGVVTMVYRAAIPDTVFIVAIVLANLLVAAAIIIDSVKLKRLREDYQRKAASSKSKAARAEQKRLRAAAREREKNQSSSGSEEVLDERAMSFREKLSYRARKSAEAANIKGSGL